MNSMTKLFMRRYPTPSKTSVAHGFSLPEVTIAVAITALALVSILGVIPGSLDSVRVAGNTTSTARIVSQVVGELQLSNWGVLDTGTHKWSKLETAMQRRWYFDDQANPIDQSTSANFDMQLSFVVRVSPSTRAVSVPGATAVNDDLKSILVDVAVSTSPSFDFSNPRAFTTYPAILARQFAK